MVTQFSWLDCGVNDATVVGLIPVWAIQELDLMSLVGPFQCFIFCVILCILSLYVAITQHFLIL